MAETVSKVAEEMVLKAAESVSMEGMAAEVEVGVVEVEEVAEAVVEAMCSLHFVIVTRRVGKHRR